MMRENTHEAEHKAVVRRIAPECMVLLKSDGSFPLETPGKLALYGNGARRTIKGGTGSGDVNVVHYVTVEEGLREAGFTITTQDWLDSYDALWAEANKAFKIGIKKKIAAEGISAIMLGIGAVMTEPDYDLPMTGEGDTAVYVLSRVSGEGSDRSAIRGDFQLTQTEVKNILQLQKQYQRFLLVLNVGGIVDLSPVSDIVLGLAAYDLFQICHCELPPTIIVFWVEWYGYAVWGPCPGSCSRLRLGGRPAAP
ncbi:MAG: glycoside hydrolase family 3 C-terminal domain-containing protein [Dysosmobacter sp.]|nr:glycoside hydrolase family 3 C-terminal domain-containing protein [Dysosmobacter sp.]